MATKPDPKELKKAEAELQKILQKLGSAAAPLKAKVEKLAKSEAKMSAAQKSLLKNSQILENDDDLDKA